MINYSVNFILTTPIEKTDGIICVTKYRFLEIIGSAIFLFSGEIVKTLMTFLLQAEKIDTLLKAANVECESYWPSLFAKLAEKKNIEDLIVNVGAGGGGGGAAPAVAAPAGGAAAAAAPVAEEKKVHLLFPSFFFCH